jgi:hypothetical protein
LELEASCDGTELWHLRKMEVFRELKRITADSSATKRLQFFTIAK